MSFFKALTVTVAAASMVLAYPPQLGFNIPIAVENRTLDQIHTAALKEGGTVTVWHGGDETYQQDAVKAAFEARFPGLTLNITVDLSKYHNVNLDRQLATNSLYVDSIVLQTLHDYPRWKAEGDFSTTNPLVMSVSRSISKMMRNDLQGEIEIYEDLRDDDGAFMGLFVYAWSHVWNTQYLNGSGPVEYTDYLKPEYKDKLVLTFPNDDDAVLYQFNLM